MIDPELRERAARICEAASASEACSAQHYALTAAQLGMDVVYYEDTDDGIGADMDAVELAAIAWLRVDPEPHGITNSSDPKRDAVAAQMLREGWEP